MVLEKICGLTKFFLFSFFLFICASPNLAIGNPVLWDDLEPGPYSVGFKVIYASDPSRPYQASDKYTGLVENNPRPIRILVWYPANVGTEQTPMTFGDYFQGGAEEGFFEDWEKKIIQRDERTIRITIGMNDLFDDLQSLETAAFFEAPPAEGKFPVILHALGRNFYRLENTVLWEFLASHGYVVATAPQFRKDWPSMVVGRIGDFFSQESQMKDLEFTRAEVGKLEFVNLECLGLMGFSGGSRYALLMAMRNPGVVDAFVNLDGSIAYNEARVIRESPYFDSRTVKFPILNLYKTSEN